MHTTIKRFIEGLEVGDPASAGNLKIFPVFNRTGAGLDYRLVGEAIAAGQVAVEEKPGGSVPTLVVVNNSESHILIADGDHLIGGMQNRIVNVTILVAPKATAEIPVSCVEAGRWRSVSRRFSMGDKAFLMLRHALHRQTKQSLRMDGTNISDQREVWRHVGEGLREAEAMSPTSAMHDVFQRKRMHLREFESGIPYVDGAAGLVAAIGEEFVFAEVYSRPEACRKSWQHTVRSLALHAAAKPADEDRVEGDAAAFLAGAAAAAVEEFPSPGAGRDLRLTGEGLDGAALVAGDEVVHCAVFAEEPAGQPVI